MGGFELFFCPGVGIRPSKNLPGGLLGLELIDLIHEDFYLLLPREGGYLDHTV